MATRQTGRSPAHLARRSGGACRGCGGAAAGTVDRCPRLGSAAAALWRRLAHWRSAGPDRRSAAAWRNAARHGQTWKDANRAAARSEERRVGKEGVSTWRTRGWPTNEKQKIKQKR